MALNGEWSGQGPGEVPQGSDELKQAEAHDALGGLEPGDLHAALKEANQRIQQLSNNSQQFEHLISSIVDYAIFAMDNDGIILSWNLGAERLKGWKAEEIIGRHLRELYLPADRERGHPEHNLAEAARLGFYQEDGWRLRKNGEVFDANISISPIYNDCGERIGFSKVTRDMTQQRRVQAQEALILRMEGDRARREHEVTEDKLRSLVDANVHKDQFLSILSHELRTPINAIMGFGSILDDGLAGPLSPTQHRYTEKILTSAEHLLMLVDDLLEMSRIRAGKFSVEPRPMALGPLVEQVAERLRPLLEAGTCGFSIAMPADLPLVLGDERRITQVLTNLVTNAIKYSPENCEIALCAFETGAFVRCEVRDRGQGIPAEHLGLVFQPFEQLDMAYTRRVGGVGLGLSIVKALVEAHGGEVGVTSDGQLGSTFWFTLPRAA